MFISREFYALLSPDAPPPHCPCQKLAKEPPSQSSSKTYKDYPPVVLPPWSPRAPKPLQAGMVGLCHPYRTPRPRLRSPSPAPTLQSSRPKPIGLDHSVDGTIFQVCP